MSDQQRIESVDFGDRSVWTMIKVPFLFELAVAFLAGTIGHAIIVAFVIQNWGSVIFRFFLLAGAAWFLNAVFSMIAERLPARQGTAPASTSSIFESSVLGLLANGMISSAVFGFAAIPFMSYAVVWSSSHEAFFHETIPGLLYGCVTITSLCVTIRQIVKTWNVAKVQFSKWL